MHPCVQQKAKEGQTRLEDMILVEHHQELLQGSCYSMTFSCGISPKMWEMLKMGRLP